MLKVWKLGSNACDTKWQPLEEMDCFKYLWQLIEDVVLRMNEGGIEHGEC